jgi:uncharacterized membrane protein YkvA (DUF1232 family)
LRKSREAVRHAEESEIIVAIGNVLEEIIDEEPLPDFVAKRIPQLDAVIRMLQDAEWNLPISERERLLAMFVYFDNPENLVPDHIPDIGYLDDIIVIELVIHELHHEREVYNDLCDYRDACEKNSQALQDSAVRRNRIDKKRQQLHQQMRNDSQKIDM